MPIVGLGTWQAPKGVIEQVVYQAVKEFGYRHLDCAYMYQNEGEIGNAITRLISEGVVTREELFITTKITNTMKSKEGVHQCLSESLQKLQVAYVDLVLIHWPYSIDVVDGQEQRAYISIHETWGALEETVEQHKAKSIGVSNFGSQLIYELWSFAKIKPAMNQIELHPYLCRRDHIAFCHELGIHVTAYSALGSSERPKHMLREENLPEFNLLDNPILKQIAERNEVSVGQLLLKFQVQRGVVAIPKSVNPDRLKQNIDLFSFTLSDEDMNSIYLLDRNFHYIMPLRFGKYNPFD